MSGLFDLARLGLLFRVDDVSPQLKGLPRARLDGWRYPS